MVLSCYNISKSFITDTILRDVSFQISEGEKVALVGINGAGKSTLFKIITGELSRDSGDVVLSSGTTFSYLAQNAFLDSDKSIYDEILTAKSHILKAEEQMRSLENDIAQYAHNHEALERLNEEYTNLSHQYEIWDGYSYKSKVKGVIKGLGFSENEFDRPVSVLSGGQRTRLALAKLLIQEPDLLLLDEPTNHLDMNATEWLEQYLNTYKGALMIISHDRYFLDHVVTKVVALENTRAKTYNGNYSFYAFHKALNEEIEEKQFEDQQREIKRQEEVIRQLKAFNREKSLKRARSREKQLDKVTRLEKPVHLNDTMHFHLSPRLVSGNDVLRVSDLQKAFDQKVIFTQVNFDIKKGEHVALIGGNGTGKSTILKIITGALPATHGDVRIGTNVHIGYYDQEHSLLNPESTLMDEISDHYPNMTNGEIRNLLASFLFTGDDVFKQISSLSGGEKGRLTLAKLMLSKANFLLLDEPTNHLDIISKEVLEGTISAYSGTVLFVSHDRYFINQVATKILYLDEDGVSEYIGDYDYFVEKRAEKRIVEEKSSSLVPSDTPLSNKELWLQKKEEETKRRRLEKQLEKTEKDIHEAEERMAEIDHLLCREDIYTDHIKASTLTSEKEELELKLLNDYETWENLHTELTRQA